MKWIEYIMGAWIERKNYLCNKKILDRVHLLGYRNDIPELMKVSGLFCFQSKREGLDLVAIETMVAGLPILTSDIRGINSYSEDGKIVLNIKLTMLMIVHQE